MTGSLSRPPGLSAVDQRGMEVALEEARVAAEVGEVPVGAAVMINGEVVCRAHNETVARQDLTQHAELIAIQRALAVLDTDRLDSASLYVTLEPCAQCAGAIVLARVGRVVRLLHGLANLCNVLDSASALSKTVQSESRTAGGWRVGKLPAQVPTPCRKNAIPLG